MRSSSRCYPLSAFKQKNARGTGGPSFCSSFLTVTNGGRIPPLKFNELEREAGAPCAGVARGVFPNGRAAQTDNFLIFLRSVRAGFGEWSTST